MADRERLLKWLSGLQTRVATMLSISRMLVDNQLVTLADMGRDMNHEWFMNDAAKVLGLTMPEYEKIPRLGSMPASARILLQEEITRLEQLAKMLDRGIVEEGGDG